MSNEPTDIIETLQEIRRRKFPDVPSTLVTQIINTEYETLENREESLSSVETSIESYLEEG